MTTRRIKRGLAVALLAILGACATPPVSDPEALAEFQETNDPIEPTNRAVFAFNDAADRYVFEPAARGYRDYVPDRVRIGIRNILTNLSEPLVFVNDVLQLEGQRAADTVGRFILNSTTGVLGLFDLADMGGTPHHKSDFGMTLASWGTPEGPYLVLPLFGPSNVRDGAGKGVDFIIDPTNLLGPAVPLAGSIGKAAVEGVDTREMYLDTLADLKKTSIDYYASLRSLYRQHRKAEVRRAENDAAVPTVEISYEDVSGFATAASLPEDEAVRAIR
ncbi:MAG: VacJ family lipoprotein [Alphaproteobacteria bacterium]